MFDLVNKLEEVEKNFMDIERQLADPEIIKKQAEFMRLSKMRSSNEEAVLCFRNYRSCVEELKENQKMAEIEKDPDMLAMVQEEVIRLTGEKDKLETQLKVLLLPKDPNDEKNTIVEIRAGAGGEEASLFAASLYRMYCRYAELKRWKIESIDSHASEKGGFKEVIFSISGEKVYSRMKFESGVHRVQRVPITEASGRIHTSTATVAVLPEAEDVDIQINQEDLRIDTFCASGHGGQSVNTTYSAIRITHLPTGLSVQCQDEKSQLKNKAKAMKVLKSRMLEIERDKQQNSIAEDRRSQVGSGDRSDKIRTYNYPQNRITDHRIKFQVNNLTAFLDGEIDEMLDALIMEDQSQKLNSLQNS